MSTQDPTTPRSQGRRYILECRHPETKALEFVSPQPPTGDFSADDIAELFWRLNPNGGRPSKNHPGNDVVGWEEIGAYFAEKHWFWREKTW